MRSEEMTYVQILAPSAARTASVGVAAEIPMDLTDIVIFHRISSFATTTSGAIDVAIEITYDDGTTYVPVLKFTQQTSATTRYISIKNGRVAEAGSDTVAARTGSSVAANTILTKKIQVYFTIAGTTPSVTSSVFLLGRRSGPN